MLFDQDQIERIAKTIINYERTGAASNRFALTAAEALVTGSANRELSYTLNIKLGCLPSTWSSRLDEHSKSAYTEGCHPLEYAAAFAEDPHMRDYFLSQFREDVEQAISDQLPGKWYTNGRFIPNPAGPGLRLDQASWRLFRPRHAAWYTPGLIARLATEQMLYRTGVGDFLVQVGSALEKAGQDSSALRGIATKCALEELATRPTNITDYVALANVIHLADQEAIEARLFQVTGSYQILGLTLRNPKPATMIHALRALAANQRLAIMQRMQRSPSIQELLASNVKGAGAIWRRMPWEILAPVVRHGNHGPTLRGALLRRTELSPDALRECLIDHPHRYNCVAPTFSESEATTDDSDLTAAPFESWAKGIQRYGRARDLAEALRGECAAPSALLLVLQHLTGRGDLEEYVAPLRAPRIKKALTRYPTPLKQVFPAPGTPLFVEKV